MIVFMSTSESDRPVSAQGADIGGTGHDATPATIDSAAPEPPASDAPPRPAAGGLEAADPSPILLSVGDAATQLSLPASTLRTWERRYGLGPSARTAGGHRRYDDVDVRRLLRMQHLVSRGLTPSEAAKSALRSIEGHIVTGADLAEAVVDAARADDSSALEQLFTTCFDTHGTVEAWSDHISITMQKVSEEWFAGGLGIDAANLVNDALLTTLGSRHAGTRLPEDAQPSVLLAAAGEERHALPLLALQAALADLGVACRIQGQRTSYAQLADLLAREMPAVVFLWASRTQDDLEGFREIMRVSEGRTQVVLGGPGWRGVDVGLPVYDGFESAAEAVRAVVEPSA